MRNNIPWLFSNWELEVLIAYFLKETKANRLTLNCIFFFTQYLVSSWTFLHNQPRVCPKTTMAEKWFSYGGQSSKKLQLQRIAFQKVWCEEMTGEEIMSTKLSRTAIIGVRKSTIILISYWKWTICSSEDYNKIPVCYLYHLKKDPPTNQDLSYRDNLVDYTLSDDVTISHFFIIIISCAQWYTLWICDEILCCLKFLCLCKIGSTNKNK